jgi:hypothetical protein
MLIPSPGDVLDVDSADPCFMVKLDANGEWTGSRVAPRLRNELVFVVSSLLPLPTYVCGICFAVTSKNVVWFNPVYAKIVST